jgi:hypothetical protein
MRSRVPAVGLIGLVARVWRLLDLTRHDGRLNVHESPITGFDEQLPVD